jgi:hypothetical protein
MKTLILLLTAAAGLLTMAPAPAQTPDAAAGRAQIANQRIRIEAERRAREEEMRRQATTSVVESQAPISATTAANVPPTGRVPTDTRSYGAGAPRSGSADPGNGSAYQAVSPQSSNRTWAAASGAGASAATPAGPAASNTNPSPAVPAAARAPAPPRPPASVTGAGTAAAQGGATADAGNPRATTSNAVQAGMSDRMTRTLEQLRTLGELRDAGYVTATEFERIKARILAGEL